MKALHAEQDGRFHHSLHTKEIVFRGEKGYEFNIGWGFRVTRAEILKGLLALCAVGIAVYSFCSQPRKRK